LAIFLVLVFKRTRIGYELPISSANAELRRRITEKE
jgi:ABC-type uncharacterized transport system permease subunit